MSESAADRLFKLHDIVETAKGAKFWGRIIAFDDDAERPGCTVLAIEPGFAGTKHVYPLAQLAPSSRETLPADVEALRARLVETIRERDIARAHDCRSMSAMGVGEGSGDLLVYGHGDAIRAARQIADDLARTTGDLRRERRANEEATLRLDDGRRALEARVALLEQALRWCRPRLSKDVYREQLDRNVSLPPVEPRDEPAIVASADHRVEVEAVAWQRLHPTQGTWVDVRQEDLDHYRREGQEIRALGVLPIHPAPVAVKALEWQGSAKGNFFAPAPWGTYSVERSGEAWAWSCHWKGTTAAMLHPCATEEAGKALAQADHDKLVRSSLLPPAEAHDDPAVAASRTAETLQANDAVWAAFYRDEKTLGQIAEEQGVSIYALSPWLTAPIVRSGLALAEPGLRGAISVAARAHEGQVDKAGRPYLAHPLRMVARALADCHDPDIAIVAALHDVVEDSAITLDDLRGIGFSERVLDAIEALTRRAGEPYRDFLLRLRPNDLAMTVKLFDIDDNVDPMRLALISDANTRERLANKYAIARSLLAVGA